MDCILCGKPMFYSKEAMTHVCLDDSHGPLAYYQGDDCYFTSRASVAEELNICGYKFHLISEETLKLLGLKP